MTVPSNDSHEWHYTRFARDVTELKRHESSGRHIIGRDTSVLGGQYGGAYAGEVLIVDSEPEKSGPIYNEYADTILKDCTDRKGKIDKQKVLRATYEFTHKLMPYSLKNVDKVNAKYGIKDFDKISLSVYAKERTGVCRHQALFVATMLEIFKQRGIISGNASIDRNIRWTEDGDAGGHAWVRYTNSQGDIFILDVAQEYIGTLEDSQKRSSRWNYLRPEELKANDRNSSAKKLGLKAIIDTNMIVGVPEHLK